MSDRDRLEDMAFRVVVMERIRELWRYEQRARRERPADWSLPRQAGHDELRVLVRLARNARTLARYLEDKQEADREWRRKQVAIEDIIAMVDL